MSRHLSWLYKYEHSIYIRIGAGVSRLVGLFNLLHVSPEVTRGPGVYDCTMTAEETLFILDEGAERYNANRNDLDYLRTKPKVHFSI